MLRLGTTYRHTEDVNWNPIKSNQYVWMSKTPGMLDSSSVRATGLQESAYWKTKVIKNSLNFNIHKF